MSTSLVKQSTRRLFVELDSVILREDIVDAQTQEQEDWLRQCGFALEGLGEVGEEIARYQDRILYRVNKAWKQLRMDSLKSWDHDFYQWAREYLIKQGRDSHANSTIDNRIRMHRDFVSEERIIELPKTVTITNTNLDGTPVADRDTGEVSMITVTPDIKTVPYSKMLTSATTIRGGEMTQEAWDKMFDPTVKHRTFEEEINKIKKGKEDKSPPITDYNFFLRKGVVYISSADRVAPLVTLGDMDDANNIDLILIGLDHILTPLGIDNPLGQFEEMLSV